MHIPAPDFRQLGREVENHFDARNGSPHRIHVIERAAYDFDPQGIQRLRIRCRPRETPHFRSSRAQRSDQIPADKARSTGYQVHLSMAHR
jgi:hypothetical protein